MNNSASQVTLLNKMGTDNDVVDAARVSFAKKSTRHDEGMAAKDIRLLRYLAKHNHWSPFSHVCLSFRVKAPIFVARQLAKHQVGLSWNEVSRRYVTDLPEFADYIIWREAAEDKKQGSGGVHPAGQCFDSALHKLHEKALDTYGELLDRGVCPEQARMVLPQSTMTEWIWTGSLYAFFRVCSLRLADDTQCETRRVVQDIFHDCIRCFPHSMNALRNV